MERPNANVKKGPWTAEEDEVLISHVKKCGPRDWSSIRSKGLLPRTGKSCRLRWVNKLRPNLKTGSKFSAEEERMVIQLQAQFGNKWAKIATYLPGRTDNDVKNFWSTRRKRFERILQKSTSLQSQNNKGKSPLVHHELTEVKVPPDPCSSAIEEGTSRFNYETHNCFSNSQEFRMVPLPDLVKPYLLNVEAEQPILEATPLNMILPIDSPPHYSLSQLPQPQLDLPFLSECKELDQDPMASDLLDMFGQEVTECESGQKFFKENAVSTKLGEVKDLLIPNTVFNDFPPEMLDYLETLTSSSEL
ncbi:hypothetical protein ACE6H2_008823 [Prunus campanulata]